MKIPHEWLEEYLAADWLGARIAMLCGRFVSVQDEPEARLELSLEARSLFQRFPLPPSIEARVFALADQIEGTPVVQAAGPSCGESGLELWSTDTKATLLEALRSAWARAFAPAAVLVPAWPELSLLDARSLNAAQASLVDRHGELLEGSRFVCLEPEAISDSLVSLSAFDEPENTPVQLAAIGAYARYALGCSYNSTVVPDDPFEFLRLLTEPNRTSRPLLERYAALCTSAGRPVAHAYLELAERSLQVESDFSWTRTEKERPAPTGRPAETHPQAVLAQHLTGLPAAPGRAAGVLFHASTMLRQRHPSQSKATVLVCERFSEILLDLKPAAVIETSGSRLGAGVILARKNGIPCVSMVRDAGLIPEGSRVRVDGGLGIVSIDGILQFPS